MPPPLTTICDPFLLRLIHQYELVETWGVELYSPSYHDRLSRYPNTYNGEPLMYAALASQKNHMALYLIGIYADDSLRQQFEKDYRASGKRMDMGKSCVRFKTINDVPLDLIGRAIASFNVDGFIEETELARSKRKKS